jgi:dipeptidyl-peptidase-4
VFGSLGPLSTEEQAAGLKALARLCPFVDLSRVAIWGWSGGGANTLNAMFHKPEVYHVGIAVVPKPQPQYYHAGYQEISMRTPKDISSIPIVITGLRRARGRPFTCAG